MEKEKAKKASDILKRIEMYQQKIDRWNKGISIFSIYLSSVGEVGSVEIRCPDYIDFQQLKVDSVTALNNLIADQERLLEQL